MRSLHLIILAISTALFQYACSADKRSVDEEPVEISLIDHWDTLTVLDNPYKGWYHHFYANSPEAYGKINDPYIDSIPNLEFLYFRLAWSYFEPEEGNYDWHWIDDVMDVYRPKGLNMVVCITTKETGISYATPEWVRKAGAKGYFVENWGLETWEPVWDDPVFLEKLDNFHRVFADRYDGEDYFQMVDIGSIGEWGEGHTGFSTGIPPTENQVKAHIDLYLKHYKNTLIVINDDYHDWEKEEDISSRLLQYQIENDLAVSEWSAMVEWYVDNFQDTYGIENPGLFDEAYLRHPVTLESHHYRDLKKENNAWDLWSSPDGREYGAEWLLGTMRTVHATYLSFQGWPEPYVKDNPNFLKYAANKLGYWYLAKSIQLKRAASKDDPYTFSIEWLNNGIAPAYHSVTLQTGLLNAGSGQIYLLQDQPTRNLEWMPDEGYEEEYTVYFPEEVTPGTYQFSIGLLMNDGKEEYPVKIALKNDFEGSTDLYPVTEIILK